MGVALVRRRGEWREGGNGGVKSGGQESGGAGGKARRAEADGSSNLLLANWILVLQIKECGRTRTGDVGFL